ncbi:MAG TPA: ATP-binding protein [Baekduia sp.]
MAAQPTPAPSRCDTDPATTIARLAAWLVDGGDAIVLRHERDGQASVVGSWSPTGAAPTSVDDLSARDGSRAPIVVAGRVWGEIVVRGGGPGPLDDLAGLAAAAIEADAELAAARALIVAGEDRTRRRIERDLHDGAQQRLVNTILMLKLARSELADVDGEGPELVEQALQSAECANRDLRALAHGDAPGILASAGLGRALEAVAELSPVPVTLDVRVAARRLPEQVELTAYLTISEALTNVVKHARASAVHVAVDLAGASLRVSVVDNGVGGADPRGSGLRGLRDRVEAMGGALTVESCAGHGTRLAVKLPIGA